MRIAIIGAGFTGLTSAFTLSKNGHKTVVFEAENTAGGLAATFRLPGWQWALEKHYHHWFTNDYLVFNLIKELGLAKRLRYPKTSTAIYYHGKTYPFNSALNVLSFSPLTYLERLRTGLVTAFLKFLPRNLALGLENKTAYEWLKKWYGEKTFTIVWQPLLSGKFSQYEKKVNMAWFWARIKKRTPRLGYLEGGHQIFIDALVEKIKKNGGTLFLKKQFIPRRDMPQFDKVIVTAPTKIFTTMFPTLPSTYKNTLNAIPHLSALNLLFITPEKFLNSTYWLNINDRNFPFIGVIQQTNMMEAKHYGGNHITWVANYLPEKHPYLKMTKEELFNIYKPYLHKINPNCNLQLTTDNLQLFLGPFAQPVFPINYSKIKPAFLTPLTNVYLANMDMVYPWDRGTNYAIELGYKVAEFVNCL